MPIKWCLLLVFLTGCTTAQKDSFDQWFWGSSYHLVKQKQAGIRPLGSGQEPRILGKTGFQVYRENREKWAELDKKYETEPVQEVKIIDNNEGQNPPNAQKSGSKNH